MFIQHLLSPVVYSEQGNYMLVDVIDGFVGSVVAISAWQDYVAAAADGSGLSVIDLLSKQSIPVVGTLESRGKINVLCWACPQSRAVDAVVYGTSNGILVMIHKQGRGETVKFVERSSTKLYHGDNPVRDVTSVAFDEKSAILVASIFSGYIHAFQIDTNLSMTPIWSLVVTNFNVLGLTFNHNNTSMDGSLWVVGLQDSMFILNEQSGTMVYTRKLGFAACSLTSSQNGVVVGVGNVANGITVVEARTVDPTTNLPIPSQNGKIRSVTFLGGNDVASGGEGGVHIFDSRLGKLVDVIRISKPTKMVQSIAACSYQGKTALLCARSDKGEGGKNSLFIWIPTSKRGRVMMLLSGMRRFMWWLTVNYLLWFMAFGFLLIMGSKAGIGWDIVMRWLCTVLFVVINAVLEMIKAFVTAILEAQIDKL